uniref:amino acid permease C-terminal domain-containing protein n=1 Tax=Staphylococcus aureus TaxID=1280 RepID=UPI00272EA0B2
LINAIIMMSMGAFDTIINLLIVVIWLFYCMSFVAVIIVRKREPDVERPYKVPLYPVIPLIAILAGSFVLINTLFTQFVLAVIGILVTALGIPV